MKLKSTQFVFVLVLSVANTLFAQSTVKNTEVKVKSSNTQAEASVPTNVSVKAQPKRKAVQSEVLKQARSGTFLFSIGAQYANEKTENSGVNEIKTTLVYDQSSYFSPLSIEYGVSDTFAVSASSSYGQTKGTRKTSNSIADLGMSEREEELSSSGFTDLNLSIKSNLEFSSFSRMQMSLSYLTSLGESKSSFQNTSGKTTEGNHFSGGNAVLPKLGFETRFSRVLVGTSYEMLWNQEKKVLTGNNQYTVSKAGSSDISQISLFSEYLFSVKNRIGLMGSYSMVKSGEGEVFENQTQLWSVKTAANTSFTVEAYGTLQIQQNWLLVPRISYNNLLSVEDPDYDASGSRYGILIGTRVEI